MRSTFLRHDITAQQASSLLRSAHAAVANPALDDDNRTAALQVAETIATDIAAIFGPAEAADIVTAALGFAIVPNTNRHV